MARGGSKPPLPQFFAQEEIGFVGAEICFAGGRCAKQTAGLCFAGAPCRETIAGKWPDASSPPAALGSTGAPCAALCGKQFRLVFQLLSWSSRKLGVAKCGWYCRSRPV
jgi:hypothetical protein